MLPAHLSGTEARGAVTPHPVAQFQIGAHHNLVYLLIDWESRESAVFDCHEGMEPILSFLKIEGIRLSRVLLTHTHWDHVNGLEEVEAAFPGAPVFTHPKDARRLKRSTQPLRDGEIFSVGRLKVEVLHTPGHSAGECSFFFRGEDAPYLWTGDTLFIRNCGRTDLESGSNEEMFASLARIRKLPSETVILPGHQYTPECASTLGRELRESPPFQCKTVKELEALP